MAMPSRWTTAIPDPVVIAFGDRASTGEAM
jgi:hypothetical protein